METITLSAGAYRLVATPEGGGLLELSATHGGSLVNILRRTDADSTDHLDRAMIVMAPWCNRIGGGGFRSGGRFHPIAPNVAGFLMPLHGNAFQSAWHVTQRNDDLLQIELTSPGPASFSYHARLTYNLAPDGLTARLQVTNTGVSPLPFGIGFHPWFETSAATRLQFQATRQLINDDAGLPVQVSPIVNDFSRPAPLPEARIDNTFLQWNGAAVLHQPNGSVDIQSTAPFLHVFSPSASAGFCCLEPQTATPDAANFRAGTEPTLAVGAQVSVTIAISYKARD